MFTATLFFIININASRDILVYYDVNDVILDFNAKLLLMVNDKATVATVVKTLDNRSYKDLLAL